MVSDFGERLALLLALADWLDSVTEGQDGQHVNSARECPEAALLRSDFSKPTQLDATPSDQAVRIIDWMARLASETA